MQYPFAPIAHIDDVLPAIKDSPEFIVVEKDGYTVINYVVAGHDTFPDIEIDWSDLDNPTYYSDKDHHAAIRRECRGLIFGHRGQIINRRYHKFFNVNERAETALERILFSEKHYVLEKLDGSMVSPCLVKGHLRWMTKMGITDTSMEAEAFVATHPEYVELALDLLDDGITPIFEWCSNKNRIVLDYPEDRLVLTAMRSFWMGHYYTYDEMVNTGRVYGVPVVKAYDVDSSKHPSYIVDLVRKAENFEGVVVRFDNGHMVKVKSDWYVRIHKVKSLLGQERDVVKLILNNELDDMLPLLPREDVERVEKFQKDLSWRLGIHAETLRLLINELPQQMDRKTFAIERAPGINAVWRGMIFQHWESGPVDTSLTYQAIVAMILNNCGSNASYEKVKEAFLKEVDYV